jgi:hypothetical protein
MCEGRRWAASVGFHENCLGRDNTGAAGAECERAGGDRVKAGADASTSIADLSNRARDRNKDGLEAESARHMQDYV